MATNKMTPTTSRPTGVQCKVKTLVNSTLLQEHNKNNQHGHHYCRYSSQERKDVWSNIDFFITYWKLTVPQAAAFHELRHLLEDDITHVMNRPNTMIRFLKVKHFHVKRAEKAIRAMFAWRAANQVDDILQNYVPPQELLDKYPGSILKGNDLVGDPVLYGRFGVTDYDGMIDKYGVDGVLRYEIYRREAMVQGAWLPKWEEEQGRPIQQLTFVEDVDGLSIKQFSFRVSATFAKVMRIQQEYYPEIEKRIIIIQTPKVFTWGWSIAKHFFDEAMGQKFVFCTPEETLQTLGQYNDLEIFPPNVYAQGHGQVVEGMSPLFCGGKIDQSTPPQDGITATATDKKNKEGHDDDDDDTNARTISNHSAVAVVLHEGTGIPCDVWQNVDYFSQYWNLTPDEHNAFLQVRDLISDLDHELNRPSIVVRFLKSKSANVAKAEIMIRTMIQWRIDNNVDDLLRSYTPPPQILAKYPGAILKGTDRVGDPVFLSRMGVTDMAGLVETYGLDEMLKFEIYKREFATTGQWLTDWEKREQRPIRQIVIIEDLHGLSGSMLTSKVASLYGQVMRLDQDNYAEASKKIIIIRAPRLFTAAWSVVKHFFDPHIVDKMEFASEHNYLELLSQYMDLSILPPCVYPQGGQGQAADGMPQNFEGGLIIGDDDYNNNG